MKVVGRAALLVLVLLAAAAGSLVGLMLVYSVHLPRSTTWSGIGRARRPSFTT